MSNPSFTLMGRPSWGQARSQVLSTPKNVNLKDQLSCCLNTFLAQEKNNTSLSMNLPIAATLPSSLCSLIEQAHPLGKHTKASSYSLSLSAPSILTPKKAPEPQLPLELKKHRIRLLTLKENYLQSSLQNAQRAYETALGVTLSNYLIDDTGELRLDRIPHLRKQLIPPQKMQTPGEKQITHLFDRLLDTDALCREISNIEAPPNNYAPQNQVIRASLGLPADAKVGDIEARRAVVSALFTHLRQGQMRSCFATARAIQLLWNEPERVARDLASIVSNGGLERTIDGVIETFPIIAHSNDDSLSQLIHITSTGELILKNNAKMPAWEIPSMVAACRAMGCESPKTVLEDAAHTLCQGTKSKHITIDAFLAWVSQAAKRAGAGSRVSYQRLYHQGRFAYVGSTSNPLAKTWEYALASMAEAKQGGLHKQLTIGTTLHVCESQLPQGSEPEAIATHHLMTAFHTALAKRVSLRYDPNPRRLVAKHHGLSHEGGFVLYRRQLDRPKSRWKRCDTAESYQKLVREAYREASRTLRASSDWLHDKPHIEIPMAHLRRYIASPHFLQNSVLSFDPGNMAHLYPVPNWHAMQRTPWINRSGAMAQWVLRMDLELDHDPKVMVTSPSSATELSHWCLKQAQNIGEIYGQEVIMAPLIADGFHAMNIIGNHPSQLNMLESGQKPKDWIAHQIQPIAQTVAHTIATQDTRSSLIDFIDAHCIPALAKESYAKQCALMEDKITHQELRGRLSDLVVSLHPEGATMRKRTEQWIDTHLARVALPETTKKTLAASRIVFADSNWMSGAHDRLLSIAPNPGNGQVELFAVNEDGSEPEALDQEFWLNRHWRICTETSVLPAIAKMDLLKK